MTVMHRHPTFDSHEQYRQTLLRLFAACMKRLRRENAV